MKKFLSIIILALTVFICCVGTVGCNSGFKLVKSVTITTNGETKTFNSSTKPKFSLIWYGSEITEEEFNDAPIDRKIYSNNNINENLSKITVNDAIKAAKNATHYEVVEKHLQGYWYSYKFHYYGDKKYHYFKANYKYTYFDFVYAKVKNDTTITIREGDTETTFTVSSYKLVEF